MRRTGCANRNRRRVEPPRGKFEHRLNLLSSDIVLLDDFLDARTDFEVSKIVATGIRVSLNTHAPPRLPGMLSTAGHCDQSRAGISLLSSFVALYMESLVPVAMPNCL